jgi:hypothetical protein
MSRPLTDFRIVPLLGLVLWVIQGILPCALAAQEDDPGLIRTLQTDSASVENAYYLLAAFSNNTSPYHELSLYGEGMLTLEKSLGLEVDFPSLLTRQPLGQVPAALGPVGVYLRYEPLHFGGWNSETAGALSVKGGGAYGFSNATFPYIGSSWTLEILGGYRVGPLFLQGNYGVQGGIDPKVPSEWIVNTGLGYHLGSNWYIQAEGDFTAITAPFSDTSFSFIPQIAFQPDDWLFELGEAFNESPTGVTELMAARTF